MVLCSKANLTVQNLNTETATTSNGFLGHAAYDDQIVQSVADSARSKNQTVDTFEISHKKLRTTAKRWSCCVSVPDSPDDPISFTISETQIHDKNRWSAFKKFFHFKFG